MSSKGMKQGNLFSFFAKKKEDAPAAAASSNNSATNGASNTNSNANAKKASGNAAASKPGLSNVRVGGTVEVYWPDDEEYYKAQVLAHRGGDKYTLKYEIDGEKETLDLSRERFRVVSSGGVDDDDDDDDDDAKVASTGEGTSKRRRILEDSEESSEESEEEDGDASGSEFEFEEEEEEEEEDEDALMVTDEDEEEEYNTSRKRKAKAKKTKTVRVTVDKRSAAASASASAATSARKNGAPSFITPPNRSTAASTAASSNVFADFAAFDDGQEDNAITKKSAASLTPPRQITQSQPSPVPPSAGTNALTPTGAASSGPAPFKKPPTPVDRVVNRAGTHWHNHFKFLHPSHVKDAKNRSPSHPDYDHRTLRVDKQEIERVRGAKLTPAMQQWWDIKSRYFDTLLLFKTGKFYEIFHMDADIAVNVLECSYMKGCDAHAGFPEVGYAKFCDQLVRAGYKVARVEQTETPDMLKERKKRAAKGKKPSVVNREVCSVSTAGTRTFCFMDDTSALAVEGGLSGVQGASSVGPLIAIKEILLPEDDSSMNDNADDDGRPVCEYGVVIVDAIRGTITVGQFADDVLRSRMLTLLTSFAPSEILIEGGANGASPTLLSLLKSSAAASASPASIERVNQKEMSQRSNALDAEARSKFERSNPTTNPWDVDETLSELHRKGYYPRASKETIKYDQNEPSRGTGRWPEVLRSCVEGGAQLALSAFGAALFYLQRSLVDDEIISMGIVKAYIPPSTSSTVSQGGSSGTDLLQDLSTKDQREQSGVEVGTSGDVTMSDASSSERSNALGVGSLAPDQANAIAAEGQIDHMALDGNTLANLEILYNSHSNTVAGSLWSKINFAKSPHGSRLLKGWLLRPLFRKADIERRADAVEELLSGGAASAMAEARTALAKMGDVERLLSRVHSMGAGAGGEDHTSSAASFHPNERAVLYENDTYTKRKVGDFSKVMSGLRAASTIPALFEGIAVQSGLLAKLVRNNDDGGFFPATLQTDLDWFFDNFDCNKAARGDFEPSRGIDDDYDEATDTVEEIMRELEAYKDEMCSGSGPLPSSARNAWKYVNIKENSKDKYLIELPASIPVPNDFFVKGKRGSGAKQINKYRTPEVEELVNRYEAALDTINEGKAKGMKLVFAKFDSMRSTWAAAATATALLDALGALAEASSQPGFTRPTILDCPPDGTAAPSISIQQGRHPCVDVTHSGESFVPNDLSLGGSSTGNVSDAERLLLLSGPNMGGKSTLLRQTCLIAILAQIGCFVPAEECSLTPVDRIFTRLGASDRILLGQSTFFVELAETAAALRGATRRSLVIMDELGRGTSTFDGTAIASASVKHLVERNRCLCLFATHYHSLLEDWKDEATVRLGHMECIVEGGDDDGLDTNEMNIDNDDDGKNNHNITFLYTLGEGTCPKSFGINVARLAALPEGVLTKAKEVSTKFESEMKGGEKSTKVSPSSAGDLRNRISEAVAANNWSEVESLWNNLQNDC